MKKMIWLLLIGLVIALPSVYAQRTTDIENSKDYPLLSRFNSSIIEFYKETKWGSYLLPVSKEGTIDWNGPMALEGRVIRTQYTVSPDNNSEFVLHNYKAAFKKAGFEVLIAIADEELGVSDRPHKWNEKYYVAGGYYNGLNNGKFGMGLSEARAKAIVDELVTKYGVQKDQLKPYGVGALCPVASNGTSEGAAKNRRVEIVEQ